MAGAGWAWTACIPAPVLRPRDAATDSSASADLWTDALPTPVDAIDAAAPFDAAADVPALDAAAAVDHTDVTATTDSVDATIAADHTDVPAIDAGRCDPGFALRAGSCVEIGTARPVWPMSTQTATQRRPALRWSLGAEADGARVELCRDRGCTDVVATFTTMGTQGTPTTELPPGPLFWRVWSRAGSAEALRPSVTWEVYVPWRNGAVGTAQRDTFDVNGDGFADFVVGVPERRELRVYLGSAMGPRPATVITDAFLDPASMLLARAGDVNGDGRADLLVRYTATGWRVYLGSLTGYSETLRSTLNANPPGDGGPSLSELHDVGDVNGDGFGDLALSEYRVPPSDARVSLHLGSNAGAPQFASETRGIPSATSVRAMGDLDGDGYEDMVTVRAVSNVTDLGATVLRGGPTDGRWSTLGAAVSVGPNLLRAWGRMDINGDGTPDALARGAIAGDRLPVFMGTRRGLDGTVQFAAPGDGSRTNSFCDGDLNGDGYTDLVIEAVQAQGVRVFVGGASGFSSIPTAEIPVTTYQRGAGVFCPGDIDGDGFGDAVVSQSTMQGTSWRLLRGEAAAGRITLLTAFDSGPAAATTP